MTYFVGLLFFITGQHPKKRLLSLLTDSNQSQLLLVPFFSGDRLSTLYTSASHSAFSAPRHAWFPDGSAVALNGDDGLVTVVSLNSSFHDSGLLSFGSGRPQWGTASEGESPRALCGTTRGVKRTGQSAVSLEFKWPQNTFSS